MTPVSGFSFKLIGFLMGAYCRHEGTPTDSWKTGHQNHQFYVQLSKWPSRRNSVCVKSGSPGPDGPYDPQDNRLTGAPQGPFSTLAIPARKLLRGKNDPSKWIFLQIESVSKGDPAEIHQGDPY